jgi:histidinol-phosphate aminotransferase
LRGTLADCFGLDSERIICGAGSDELITLLCRAYAGPGDEVLHTQHGFLMYAIAARTVGATPVVAPETNLTTDVDALLAKVTDRTRMVFLANPNNPTGTYLPASEVERLHKGLRKDILFVLDNAYAEYVTAPDFSVGIDLVDRAENVVMVRTFSKIGLAALRIGWMYAQPAVIDAVNRIRGPFNLTVPAQYAGAEAARDAEFTAALSAHNHKWRDWLSRSLQSNRLRVIPSQGNFVLVLFLDRSGADEAFEALRAKGLIVRQMGGYGIPNGLRISIGKEEHMRAVVEVLKQFGASGAVA